MRLLGKLVLVSIIVALGVLAAMQFPKSGVDTAASVTAAPKPTPLPLRRPIPLQVAVETGDSPAASTEVSPTPDTELNPLDRIPAIMGATPPFIEPSDLSAEDLLQAEEATPPAAEIAETPPCVDDASSSPSDEAPTFRIAAAEPPPSSRSDVRHRIVDGDTLTALAEKYLGGGDRRLEIYDANRDVLPSPDLLPIGIEIAIPGR